MRLFLTIMLVLAVFTTNHVALAFEQCVGNSCLIASTDAAKQAEHQKKEPNCLVHCSMSSHHAAAIPQDFGLILSPMAVSTQQWSVAPIPKSATLEGLVEPPSIA